MLHLTDLSKSFGTQVILDGASLHVRPGMRLGLVGPNGAGKTTLLRILAGETSLDEGEINARKGLRMGFLPQEIEEIADHGVLEEVLASYGEVLRMELRLKELGDRIASAYSGGVDTPRSGKDDPDALLHEMGELQTDFEAAGGYELESRAQSILRGMGFTDADFYRRIEELSGGWRMRVALSRLLMEQPDLLLLDEPSNHLDLESLIWLEEFLLDWQGALIVIAHDRYFLNRIVTHVVELDRGLLDLYTGDYDSFESEKRQRHEALVSSARNQQREIESAESFIKRFRAKNTKAKQVQQKIRRLDKLERIDAPTLDRKRISFRFPQPGRTGRVVVELEGVRKAYGDNVVYRRLDLVVERGEKIALVGPNGAGKSTLLKLLAGVIEPDGGKFRLGHSVRREYFAQHQLDVFDPDLSVLKTMEECAARVDKLQQVRGYLGAFLFSGDDVDKKVSVLSGGEKARLALARMLLDPAGLLLLDEPTNHLDMASRDVLTEALRQFEGSIIFISHDRYLINAIGTKVIDVESGTLTHYAGDWEYYSWKKAQPDKEATESAASATSASRSTPATSATPARRSGPSSSTEPASASTGSSASAASGAQSTVPYRQRKEVQRRHRQVEKSIMELEARQEWLAQVLADPANMSDYELLTGASSEATEVREQLAALYPEWERLAEASASFERPA